MEIYISKYKVTIKKGQQQQKCYNIHLFMKNKDEKLLEKKYYAPTREW